MNIFLGILSVFILCYTVYSLVVKLKEMNNRDNEELTA